MKRLTMMAALAACLGACAEESDLRDPESFVPPDVLAKVEGPVARACMARFYLIDARSLECTTQAVGVLPADRRPAKCESLEESGFIDSECLDLWANGTCSDLTTPNAPEGCAMVNEW